MESCSPREEVYRSRGLFSFPTSKIWYYIIIYNEIETNELKNCRIFEILEYELWKPIKDYLYESNIDKTRNAAGII